MTTEKNTPKKSDLTYQERAGKLQKKAAGAEYQKITAVHNRFEVATKGIERNAILAANSARELGIHLQALAGREIISDRQGRFLWEEKFAAHLPFSYESACMFVAISRKMPEPVRTIEEAVQFVQQALIADNLLQLPERGEQQSRSAIGIMEKFLMQITLVRQPFSKALKERPMETWDVEALDKFLSETEWVDVERKRAEELRKAAA